jgi:carboxypeptidase family protein
MSPIGRFLAVIGVLLGIVTSPAFAETMVKGAPVKGAFVTLEKVSSGLLKYASTKADGAFKIEDVPNGRYRMSITPPNRDRGEGFTSNVQVSFVGIEIKAWSERSKKRAKASGGAFSKESLAISKAQWQGGPIWLDVSVTNRTVSGAFSYH